MATFDPKNPPGGSGQNDNSGVAAGEYLLILKSFKRNVGKSSGKAYLRGVFQVIHGPARGKTFFDSLSLDMGNSGAMFRLSMLCEQVGSGAFDLDDDQAVRDAICRKPFKARVSREVSGQYTNNGINRYLNKEVTDFDRRVMDTWLVEEAERQQYGGGGGGGDDDEYRGPRGGGTDENGLPFDDAPHSADSPGYGGGHGGRRPDDDIPF